MSDDIRFSVNGIELLFWDGQEFSQGSPLAYELSVDGEPVRCGPFDPNPLPYRTGFLVAGRAQGFWGLGFAVYWFESGDRRPKRVSKVEDFLSLRSAGDGFVEAATKAYGDGDVKRIPIQV